MTMAGRRRAPTVPQVQIDARALLEQRLLEIAVGDADLAPERQHVVGRKGLTDVALAGLELRRALKDPFERRTVDAGGLPFCHATPRGPLAPSRFGAWT